MQRWMMLGIAALLLVGAGVGGWWWWNEQREQTRVLTYTIPQGSAARLAAGETLQILPLTILLALDGQDTLIIRNDDSEPVTIGPYRIEPGQQFRQRFYNPGTFELTCSVHKGEILRIVVKRRTSELQNPGLDLS